MSDKTFTVIKGYTYDDATVLRLSEPIRLLGAGKVAEDGKLASPCEEFDVVIVVALAEAKHGGFDRTMIHAGVPVDEQLSGTYWAVTGQYSRRVDGIADVNHAMALQGYAPAKET